MSSKLQSGVSSKLQSGVFTVHCY